MSTVGGNCDYCGLPLPGAGPVEQPPALACLEPVYCCFGCRFAADVTRERGDAGAASWTLIRLGLSIFFTMNVLAFTMALWTGAVYGEDSPTPQSALLADVFRYLGLLFSLPVLFLLGQPLLENAWADARRGKLSTDLLLASGVAAAYAYSLVSVIRESGDVYFEVGCVILVLVTLGRWLEATGRLRASAALDELEKLLPAIVRVIRGGLEQNLPAVQVVTGDRVRVLPGERFPADGRLGSGFTVSVDEQALTGESWPVIKTPGESILGGALNLDGDVVVDVTAPPGNATLSRLIDIVRSARNSRGRFQRQADRVAALFFPVITLVAVGTFWFHWRNAGLPQAILVSLSVVLIACPCALGVATPLAMWTALGQAARRQILFRTSEALERLAEVKVICFDKTGTLTTGAAHVASLICDSRERRREVVRRARALACASAHPFSRAIVDFSAGLPEFSELRISSPAFDSIQSYAGSGIVGRSETDGSRTVLGSLQLMRDCGLKLEISLENAWQNAVDRGEAVACVGWNGWVRGLFVFQETVRPSTRDALAWCRRQGYHVVVLTGDRRRAAQRLGLSLGVDVHAELLPEDKLKLVSNLQCDVGPVAMVGDGINDAPALCASHVGVTLGCGTDLARDSAGICLLANDLSRLCWSLQYARGTVRMMRRSLFWAFFYNTSGVAAAAAGLLSPAAAALLMVGSSFLVIRNSLRGAPVEIAELSTATDVSHARLAGREGRATCSNGR